MSEVSVLSVECRNQMFIHTNTYCITSCSDSDSTDKQIGIIGKPLSNFDTTSLTELEKEDDEDDDDDDDDNDPDGLETSARSYRTRYRIYCMSLIMTCW